MDTSTRFVDMVPEQQGRQSLAAEDGEPRNRVDDKAAPDEVADISKNDDASVTPIPGSVETEPAQERQGEDPPSSEPATLVKDGDKTSSNVSASSALTSDASPLSSPPASTLPTVDAVPPVDDIALLEKKALELASQAKAITEVKEAYELLCRAYRKEAAGVTRADRQRLGKHLCDLGEPLSHLDVFLVTWNVGNAAPSVEQFEQMIPTRQKLHDIVVVGLQECEYELVGDMGTKANGYHKQRHHDRKAADDLYEKPDHWYDRNAAARSVLPRSVRNQNYADGGSDDEAEGGAEKKKKKEFSMGHFMHKKAVQAEKGAKRAITSRAGSHFASLVHSHLGSEDYFLVRECELMQMRLFVFARTEHRPRISHVEYASQATGIGGVVGNKGGVAVSLKFQDIRLCFLSCHLAAHRKFLAERNRDCEDVLNMLQKKLATPSASYLSDWDYVFFFGDLNYRLTKEEANKVGNHRNPLLTEDDDMFDYDDVSALNTTSVSESPAPSVPDTEPRHPFAATADATSTSLSNPLLPSLPSLDKLSNLLLETSSSLRGKQDIMSGDGVTTSSSRRVSMTPRIFRRPTAEQLSEGDRLIQRTDHTLNERDHVLNLIHRKEWMELMNRDQLRTEQKAGRALMGFHEAEFYPFPPTFKVDRSSELGYNSKRLPAYCDRILWHSTPSLLNEQGAVTQLELFSPLEVSTSDHKPVCSTFKVTLRPQVKRLRKSTAFSRLNWSMYFDRFPLRASPKNGLQIVISNLRAKDLCPMDLSGTADPYIVAYSTELFGYKESGHHPSKGICRTRVCFGSLNCTWSDPLIIQCADRITRPDDLSGKHLTLSVWDFDTFSRDDHIGEVVLSLDDLVAAYSHSSAMVSDRFEAKAREAYSHVVPRREDSEEQDMYAASPGEGGEAVFEEQLSDGRKLQLHSRQLAFSYPIIQGGRIAGNLSGVATLHPSDHKVGGAVNLKMFGLGWKFRAYLEQCRGRPGPKKTTKEHEDA